MLKALTKGGWLRVRVLVTSQGTHIFLFLTVNVILGALGFLVPIAIEYAATDSFMPALKKQLDAAGAYTFAIAFLASCVSLVVAEYLDQKEIAEYRNQKTLLSIVAGLIMIFCSVFSGSQTARSVIEDSIKEQSHSSVPQLPPISSPSMAAPAESGAPPNESRGANPVHLTTLDVWQLRITALAVVVGLLLFIVFKYQQPSMKEELSKYLRQTEEDAQAIMSGLQVRGRN